MMALADGPEFETALVENRLGDIDVGGMVVAAVRVVEDEDIALVDVTGKRLGDTFYRIRQGAHQDGDVCGLGNQPQVLVKDGGDEIARFGKNRRA